MADLEDITYFREATIAAVTDYYTFLTRMYLNESHVVYPPAGGWPSIVNADPAALQSLGKSDEVLALMAHLPYIRYAFDTVGALEDTAQVTPGSTVADWSDLIPRLSSSYGGDSLRILTEGTFADISPPHVFGLFRNRDEAMVLDAELDIFGDRRGFTDVDWDLDDEVSQEEADWRHSAPAWEISDFFKLLKDQLIRLDWIPISPFTVRDGHNRDWPHEKGMMGMLEDIYRQHGWPDLAVYRKSDCLRAVQKAMAEKYPLAHLLRDIGKFLSRNQS
ncbi:hypothetical protein C8A03DRAFT_46546 [Achaetomium macrosporum]|uniref:Uncharacterized protein n=1 Tax=Achaetomium macrosporum TaxID=79813 RepID=A0AAN7H992_9PEZI|nr:hypothetical protein C8A03DRAFT_46546 [Achaetomium macrosporum]